LVVVDLTKSRLERPDDRNNPALQDDFKAQARSAFQSLKAQVEADGGNAIADFKQIIP
jgi:enamine deaminase RidA (YjgF/YER057c/UK114 family)